MSKNTIVFLTLLLMSVTLTINCRAASAQTGPVITATISPAVLPVTGGLITISATVTDIAGRTISSVTCTGNGNLNNGRTFSLSNSGTGNVYTAELQSNGTNTGNTPVYYWATVTATDSSNASTTAVVSGQVTQEYDHRPPTITNASISPATLPLSGGVITVTATVVDPEGRLITSVTAAGNNNLNDGRSFPMSNGGSGNIYTAQIQSNGNNTGSTAELYFATVSATDDFGLTNTAPASGQVSQAFDNSPPTISSASITPAYLPVTGGVITVTATITDPNGRAITSVTGAGNDNLHDGVTFTLSKMGSSNVYSVQIQSSGTNTGSSPIYYYATVYATNDLGLTSSASATGTVTQVNSGPPASVIPTLFTLSSATPVLSPAFVPAGSANFTLTINGTNFMAGATVLFNGVTLASTSVTTTKVTVVIPAALLADQGSYAVEVANPVPGAISNAVTFTVD